jgi:hypothetical protein
MSATKTINDAFDAQLRKKAQLVNDTLQRILAEQLDIDSDLKKAIMYTLEAPANRIR